MTKPLLRFDCQLTYPSGFTLEAKFTLPQGISAILGPSGSGKSTCLALIAGWLEPQRGAIHLHDRLLVDRPRGRWLPPHRRDIGMVAQDHLLFPHLTVRANLRYGMKRARRQPQSLTFEQVVEVLGLQALLDRHPSHLSGGQQRRVALGRTLLSQPGLILLDEPLAGLDEPMQDRVLTLLQQVHAHWQLPMVLVSHDLAQVRRVASFAVTLEAGRVVHEGAINPPAVIAQDSHASRQDQEVNGATACNGRKGPRPSHTLSSHPLSQRFFH